jgi:ankyrin repeat protein
LTPLDFALGRGDDEVINCLKYDPKKVSICLAAKHGDLGVFVALMNQGVSVNAKLKHLTGQRASQSSGHGNSNTSSNGSGVGGVSGVCHELSTPLFAAVTFEQIDFIKKILDPEETRHWPEKVDLNGINFLGQTPLMAAVHIKSESLVLYLLKQGANRYMKDIEGNTAADWAQHYQLASIHMILVCDPQTSCVHAAIRDGNIEATKAFFKQNPDPNMRWFSSQPYARNMTPLAAATATGSGVGGAGGENLKATGTREILDGEPPMIVAAKFNRISVILLLLKAPGVDINIVDTFGKTPLMHAAENGYEECVLFLLKQKANRNALDYLQKKALHYALESRFHAVAAILEADPYKVHIHDACEEGKVSMGAPPPSLPLFCVSWEGILSGRSCHRFDEARLSRQLPRRENW